jgi:glucosamine-6-phosphate deaminase
MNRKTEIRALLRLTPQEVQTRAGERLVVCADLDALHEHMARDIALTIQAHNDNHQPTRLILPVGPTGQYPILADIINHEGISLKQCWFYFMDEYCDENMRAVTCDHPLSFKRVAHELFFSRLNGASDLNMERVIFPDENNIHQLAAMIDAEGGIDVCYGGIGLHGHVAFNEPEAGVKDSDPRCVRLNDFTVTINAVRSKVGGNLEGYPRYAYTLGMRQILAARKIRLYCRNGGAFDWANTVLRLALFGTPDDDYPVTHIRNRDYVLVTDEDTLATPDVIL